MTIQEAIKEYLLEIQIRKYTQKTVRSYTNNLHLFNEYCKSVNHTSISDLNLSLIKSFTAFEVKHGRKGTYINSLLKVVKSFTQYAFEEGYGGFDTKARFPWVQEQKTLIRAFRPSDVTLLLNDCRGNDFLSLRDRCILTMLFETGVRCWELCCIKDSDIHDDFIVIVNGKHHKQRVVPITPILGKAMLRYKRARDNQFPFPKCDYYFVSFHDNQLTNSAVEHVLKKHGEGIEGVRVSPHTARHTFAQQQVKMGTDLYTISRLLGHESIAITQTYLNSLRDEEIVKIAKSKSVLGSL